jgi:hypothetical protein
VSRATTRAVTALTQNALRLRATDAALMTAIDRATGAGKAGNEAARIRQLRAAARYARKVGALLAAGPRLRARLARALRAEHRHLSATHAQMAEAQHQIAAAGLPAKVIATLRQLGYSDNDVQQLARNASQQAIPGSTVSAARILRNPQLDAANRRVAKGFRAEAAALTRAR